eukprot:3801134-Alexandrium_andersonii.AAC.1
MGLSQRSLLKDIADAQCAGNVLAMCVSVAPDESDHKSTFMLFGMLPCHMLVCSDPQIHSAPNHTIWISETLIATSQHELGGREGKAGDNGDDR